MPQPIQPIKDAIQRGDKEKAIELIKQAINVDPKDVDVLLALATIVEEPTRKRQVLNRILSMEPTHKAAREMLLEMDRAELGAYRRTPVSVPAPAPKPSASNPTSHAEVVSPNPPQKIEPESLQDAVPSKPTPKPQLEKPLVFRYSTVWLVILYLFTSLFCCGGLLIASQNIASSLPYLALGLLFGLTALSVSSKVEVRETGIRSSSLLGSTEIGWNEIASLKSNSMNKKLELISNKGKPVKISTQVRGYPVVIELLRQKRPELFDEAKVSPAEGIERLQPTTRLDSPAFTGSKAFKKSFFKQYGLLFALVPMCLLFAWLGLAEAETRMAFFIMAGVCALLMLIPFFQVSAIKVEPNRLTIQTFFEEKEFSAQQIKEIKMQSVHGRYGRVTNFVNIIPSEGKKYPLGGFTEGEEIIYGYLMNWWARYQSK